MTLVFVYNAFSGKLHSALDIAHKIISPKTYNCKLCSVTHNTFSEKKSWKAFRENSNLELIFYHKDEFETVYPKETFNYPIILKKTKHSFSILLTKNEIDSLKSEKELFHIINAIL